MDETRLRVLPLGGLGEIGLNMMAIVLGGEAFFIDAGLMFPDDSMPGVDFAIPDLDVVIRQGWNVRGIVLTHGHEDHIGALPYCLKKISVPVYATGLTMGLVENKLEEHELLEITERQVISANSSVQLGPFRIDPFAVCHSVADGVGLIVTTPAGIIVHSGDFKIDPTPIDGRLCDLEKLASFAQRGVLALFSDSTNVSNKGTTLSEIMIRPAFEKIFEEAQGRVLIATFSSNIHRIQQVLTLSKEFGRKVVLVGRSMAANVRIASERGYLSIPDGILVDMKDMDALPDARLTVLSTGTQGEPMSALSLMAFGRHKYLKVKPGDVVVLSSRFIPGNERAIHQIINEFSRGGARVMYEEISDVHVSGHASEEELRYLIRTVNPKCFIPVHGEYRHLLRHGEIAIEEGISRERVLVAQDGDLIELSSDGPKVVEQMDVGRVFVHGKGVGDLGDDVLRDRRILSEVGVVTVVLVIDGTTGNLLVDPVVRSLGVTFEEVDTELAQVVSAVLRDQTGVFDRENLQWWEEMKEEVRLAVRRHVNRVLGRKPLVQTIVIQR